MKKVAGFVILCFFAHDIFAQHRTELCLGRRYRGIVFDTSYNVLKSIDNQAGRVVLTCSDIAIVESILKKKLKEINIKRENQNQGCPNIRKKLSRYTRQYFGFENQKGEKIVWVNLFWDRNLSEPARSELIMVNDGCSYYWNIEVNLSLETLSNLQVNGKG